MRRDAHLHHAERPGAARAQSEMGATAERGGRSRDGARQVATSFTMTTGSGIHATPIAEYTIASMLAYAHKFHLMIRAQLRHEWLRSGFPGTVEELRGKTFGIIGYGSIGREIGAPREGAWDARPRVEARSRQSARRRMVSAGPRRSRRRHSGEILRTRAARGNRARVRLPHRHTAAHASTRGSSSARAKSRRCARRVHREHRARRSDR